MTKEQEATKYIEKRIKICNENADICDDNDFDEEATYLREESYMLETVLNMLKEKDKEIETLKRDFKIVDQECSRLERKEAKQDKIIDLMAEDMIKGKCYFSSKTLLKKHYESKVEK